MNLRIDIITLFPSLVEGHFQTAIMERSRKRGFLSMKVHNLRSFTLDRYRTVDDYPFGGGPGMVLKPEPVFRAVRFIRGYTGSQGRVVITSAQGKLLKQSLVEDLAHSGHLILVCGRYQGIDERVIDMCDAEEISIGDYVLSGGELPALVIAESVVRCIPGVLGDEESARIDSFQRGILGFPQYTRPREFREKAVPEVLLSGHEARIKEWREQQALEKTRSNRPDLLHVAKGFPE